MAKEKFNEQEEESIIFPVKIIKCSKDNAWYGKLTTVKEPNKKPYQKTYIGRILHVKESNRHKDYYELAVDPYSPEYDFLKGRFVLKTDVLMIKQPKKKK